MNRIAQASSKKANNMAAAIIVYAPHHGGKMLSHYGFELRRRDFLVQVEDEAMTGRIDWDQSFEGFVVLTTDEAAAREHAKRCGSTVKHINDALREIGMTERVPEELELQSANERTLTAGSLLRGEAALKKRDRYVADVSRQLLGSILGGAMAQGQTPDIPNSIEIAVKAAEALFDRLTHDGRL